MAKHADSMRVARKPFYIFVEIGRSLLLALLSAVLATGIYTNLVHNYCGADYGAHSGGGGAGFGILLLWILVFAFAWSLLCELIIRLSQYKDIYRFVALLVPSVLIVAVIESNRSGLC